MRATRTPGLYLRGRIFTLRLLFPCLPGEPRREIVLSLGTSEPKRAKLLALEVKRHMAKLLNAEPELAHDEVRERLRLFARDYFRRTIGDANEELVLRKEMEDPTELAAEKEADLTTLRHRLSKGPSVSHRLEAQAYLQRHLDQLVGDKETTDYLASLLLRAELEAARLVAAKLRGNFAECGVKDEVFAGMDPDLIKPAPDAVGPKGELSFPAWWSALGDGTTPALTQPAPKDNLIPSLPPKPLAEAVADYLDEKQKAKPNKKSLEDIEKAISFLSFAFPELTYTSQLTKQHVLTLQDDLPKLPANFKKHKTLSKMSFKQLVGKPHPNAAPIKGRTAKKYLGNLRAFVEWCQDHDFIASSWRLPQMPKYLAPKASKKDRESFSEAQLVGLFTSPQYLGHRPDLHKQKRRWQQGSALIRDGYYWLPLLALWTGARMSELLQLNLTDIYETNGIWHLDINDNDLGKSLKTSASVRLVPVHPQLVTLGFIDFVVSRQQGKHQRLLYDVELGPEQPHSIYSKYFSRYLENIKHKTKKTSFHSFRHNFVDASHRAQINRTVEYALVGHVEGDDVHSIYGSAPQLDELKAGMDKITYPAPVMAVMEKLLQAAEQHELNVGKTLTKKGT